MSRSKVAIVKKSEKPDKSQIEATVRQAIELVGGLDDIKKGDIEEIKRLIAEHERGELK